MKKGHIYVRISKDKGSRLSIDAQQSLCEKYAKANNLDVVGVYKDIGISGALDIAKRPGLLSAVLSMSKGDVLLIADSDRLGRDTDKLSKLDVTIHDLGGDIVDVLNPRLSLKNRKINPDVFLMRYMKRGISEYERLQISDRIKRALHKKREQGYRLGYVPYGYISDANGFIRKNTKEQSILRRMNNFKAAGYSCNQIADKLNEKHTNRNGKPWHKVSVWRVLKNEKTNSINYGQRDLLNQTL